MPEKFLLFSLWRHLLLEFARIFLQVLFLRLKAVLRICYIQVKTHFMSFKRVGGIFAKDGEKRGPNFEFFT